MVLRYWTAEKLLLYIKPREGRWERVIKVMYFFRLNFLPQKWHISSRKSSPGQTTPAQRARSGTRSSYIARKWNKTQKTIHTQRRKFPDHGEQSKKIIEKDMKGWTFVVWTGPAERSEIKSSPDLPLRIPPPPLDYLEREAVGRLGMWEMNFQGGRKG